MTPAFKILVTGSTGSFGQAWVWRQAEPGVLTLTDRAMTRFWLFLGQVVDLVLEAVGLMKGGEIFVPKIPSMSILDLARAIAPAARIDEVGGRPGEKLHEILLTAEESSNANGILDSACSLASGNP